MEDFKEMSRILVTGSDGQLGKTLRDRLPFIKAEVLFTTRNQCDITDRAQVLELVTYFQPSYVINCAGWTDVEAAEKDPLSAHVVNVGGVKNLVAACQSVRSTLIHFSTDYVFNGSSSSPWLESDKRDPISEYGKSKAQAEQILEESFSEKSIIIRTAWLYSKYGANFVKTMVKLSQGDSQRIEVVNDQIGQPTFATDLADKTIELIQSSQKSGIFHGTNSGETSWYELARYIFEINQADSSRIHPISSSASSFKAARPSYSVLSHQQWDRANIAVMRPWNIALKSAMPEILREVERTNEG